LFAHAGQDLEASHLGGWQQAASILDQVARALSQVEEEYEFEVSRRLPSFFSHLFYHQNPTLVPLSGETVKLNNTRLSCFSM
jgi:hypothetical protein